MTEERTERELRTWFAGQTEPEVPDSLRRFLSELPGDEPTLGRVQPRPAGPLGVDRHRGTLRLLVACAVIALVGVGLIYGSGQRPAPPVSGSPAPSEPHSSPATSPAPSIGPATAVLDAAPIDAEHGWALTGDDVLWTDDAGITWRSIKPPPASADATIRAVHFLDRNTGWVVSWSPEERRRPAPTDARRRQPLEPLRRPGSVPRRRRHRLCRSRGCRYGLGPGRSRPRLGLQHRRAVRQSRRGGDLVARDHEPGRLAARFISLVDGWTFAGPLGDHLQVTRDGGRTWREVPIALPPGHEQDDARSFDLPTFTAASGLPEIGVLPVTLYGPPDPNTSQVTATLALYTSDDLGATWRFASVIGRTTSLGQGGDHRVHDRRPRGLARGPDPRSGALSFTKDGGARWDDLGSTGLADIAKLRFAAVAHGWALTQSEGSGYRLSATVNGGKTWRPLEPVAAPADAPSPSAAFAPYRWTLASTDPEVASYAVGQAIRRTDGTFLAVGFDQEVRVLRSPDGRTWTVEPRDPGLLAAAATHLSLVDGVADGANGLVAVGATALDDISSGDARAWTSPDGVAWHAAEVAGATDAAMKAVAASPDGYVAVGSDGFPGGNVQLPGARGAAVWTSPDGAHWTRVADQPSFQDAIMTGVRRLDAGYVAWGQTLVGRTNPPAPPVWASPDGIHWDRGTGVTGTGGLGWPIASIVAVGGRLVAVGTREIGDDQGTAYVPGAWISDDGGRTWTVSPVADAIATTGGSGGAFDVATDGAGVVVVGYVDSPDGATSAAAWRSSDQGATWTRLTDDPSFAGASIRHIVSTETGFLAFGQADDPTGGPTRNLIWVVDPSTP